MKNSDRLYRTDKEERTYRELKDKYKIKDAVVVEGHPGVTSDRVKPQSDNVRVKGRR